jgi:16S rRNA processing protein RimM
MKISVAYIKGPRGFKGEMAAMLYKPSSKSLRPDVEVTLKDKVRSQDFKVQFIKVLKNRIGLKLKGIEDEETAKSWQGSEVLIDEENLEPLAQSEYYHYQIEDSDVYDEDGELVGKVKYVESNAGNDLLFLTSEKGEIIIPFVKAIVKSVEIDKKKIVVRKIDGLF